MSLSVQLAYKQATVYLGIRKSLVKIGTYSSDLYDTLSLCTW